MHGRLKGLSAELEEAHARNRKPMQVQSISGSIRNGHILASVKEENQGQEHVSSEENPRKNNRWWQFN